MDTRSLFCGTSLFLFSCAAAPSIVSNNDTGVPQVEVSFEDKDANPEQTWHYCRLPVEGNAPLISISYSVHGPWVNYVVGCIEETKIGCFNSPLKIFIQSTDAIFSERTYISRVEKRIEVRFGWISGPGVKALQSVYIHFECDTSGF